MAKIVALTFLLLCMLGLGLPILAIWHIAWLKLKLLEEYDDERR